MPASHRSNSTKPARSRADAELHVSNDLEQDDANTDPDQPQNFKLIPWSTVEAAIKDMRAK